MLPIISYLTNTTCDLLKIKLKTCLKLIYRVYHDFGKQGGAHSNRGADQNPKKHLSGLGYAFWISGEPRRNEPEAGQKNSQTSQHQSNFPNGVSHAHY